MKRTPPAEFSPANELAANIIDTQRVKRILDGEDDDEHEGRLLNF
jgi:hypothetical protein